MVDHNTTIVLTLGIFLGFIMSVATTHFCKKSKAKKAAVKKAGEGEEEGEEWTDEGTSEEDSAEEDGYIRN